MKTISSTLRRSVGFTIVELLIVIVVIAVLAAITVVAFNGIRERAAMSSLKSDLSAAAKKMELAKVDNAELYPATLPAGVSASNGNVLQLTAVADQTREYCINGYGPGNKSISIETGGMLREYLCAGATIGTAVGGSVPTAARGVNLLAGGFSTWTTSGGITYNSSTDEMICSGVGIAGTATSPLIRVDSPTSGSFGFEGYATLPTPTRAYSGVYAGSSYYQANGTTSAFNAAPSPGPYSGNGYASSLSAPFSSWQARAMSMTLGPNIIYVRLRVQCDNSVNGYTSDTRYRSPTYVVY